MFLSDISGVLIFPRRLVYLGEHVILAQVHLPDPLIDVPAEYAIFKWSTNIVLLNRYGTVSFRGKPFMFLFDGLWMTIRGSLFIDTAGFVPCVNDPRD